MVPIDANEASFGLRAEYQNPQAHIRTSFIGQRYRYQNGSDPTRVEAGLGFGFVQQGDNNPVPYALLVLADGNVILSSDDGALTGDQSSLPNQVVQHMVELLPIFLRSPDDGPRKAAAIPIPILSPCQLCQINCYVQYGQIAWAVGFLGSLFYFAFACNAWPGNPLCTAIVDPLLQAMYQYTIAYVSCMSWCFILYCISLSNTQ